MPWPQCTKENNELKDLLIAVLDSETLSSSQSIIEAARIQGHWTFYAGICALVAGILAYWAATKKLSMEEAEHKAKKISYHHHMLAVLTRLGDDMEAIETWAVKFLMKQCAPPSVSIPDAINSTHWQSHALLQQEIAKDIYELYRAMVTIKNALQEIEQNNLGKDSHLNTPYKQIGPDKETVTRMGPVHIFLGGHLKYTSDLIFHIKTALNEYVNKK